jgi:DNA-directed RNA polymerase alpha subunit
MPSRVVKTAPRALRNLDKQRMELQLTDKEQQALTMLQAKVRMQEIRKVVFDNKISRQACYDTVRRAERKLWRLQARERHAENPADCPIDELPLTSRVRFSLKHAGYETLGQLAAIPKSDLEEIKWLGRHAIFEILKLLKDWGVRKPGAYCPPSLSPECSVRAQVAATR